MLILFEAIGITSAVSPSKSAPESCSATFVLMPTASEAPAITRFASACLLLTFKTGISKVPPCGYRTRATTSPSLKFGAYISVSFKPGMGKST